MTITRRQWLEAAAASLLGPTLARAQTPSVGGKVIYGFEAGGSGARIGEALVNSLNQLHQPPLAMEYMTGAGSRKSCEFVKNAPPDGLTLLQAASFSLLLFPSTFRNLPYAPSDFVPLANLANTTYSFTVGPRVPKTVDTLDKYLKWVSDNPNERNYGVFGNGSSPHLAGLSIARAKDLALRAQPYTGTRSLLQDMLGGTLSAGFTPVGAAPKLFEAGQLRSLGVCSSKRWPGYEQIPTLMEQGVTDLDIVDWVGWFAPAATPTHIVEALRQALAKALASPEFVQVQKELSGQPDPLPANSLTERMVRDAQNFQRLVKLNHVSQAS